MQTSVKEKNCPYNLNLDGCFEGLNQSRGVFCHVGVFDVSGFLLIGGRTDLGISEFSEELDTEIPFFNRFVLCSVAGVPLVRYLRM
jgi:hypothetical protein